MAFEATRPFRPFTAGRDYHCAAGQLPRTGHSAMPQHLLVLSVCDAGLNPISRLYLRTGAGRLPRPPFCP